MTRTKNTKRRRVDAKRKKKQKQQPQQRQQKPNPKKKSLLRDNIKLTAASVSAAAAASDSDSDSSLPDSQKIQKLLEPYSKEQLIEFLCDSAISDSSVLSLIRSAADRDISHRKIFVHSLAWDATRDALLSAFQPFGEIEECNVVVDKATGKAKGYGFVVFKHRTAAAKALKQPQKKIRNRTAFCQLAAVGPSSGDSIARKIYVSNVPSTADPNRLLSFFSRFGEIEAGPLGFDQISGRSRGFALFVYKTPEGAKKALHEAHKIFEGHQLHCQKAADPIVKSRPAAAPQPPTAPGAEMLAAAAAAQNIALFTHNPTLNPAFNALIGNPAAAAGLLSGNPLMAGANTTATSGLAAGNQPLLSAYSVQGYQTAQLGHPTAAGRTYGAGGLPPYL